MTMSTVENRGATSHNCETCCCIGPRTEYSLTKVALRTNTSGQTEPKISSIGNTASSSRGRGCDGRGLQGSRSVLERTVAIKVMNDSIARPADLRKRFLHEAQAAGFCSTRTCVHLRPR